MSAIKYPVMQEHIPEDLIPQIIFCSTIQHASDNSLQSFTYFAISSLSRRCHESIFNLGNKSMLQSCLSVSFAVVGNNK